MTGLTALRDIVLVGWFEVLRALRTWRALALFVLYGLATAGAAYTFVGLVWVMENALAKQLGVPETETPGAMMQKLVESDSFRGMIEAMVGSEAAVDQVLAVPVLAVFNLWFGFLLIPFFAASAAAESVSIDMGTRSLRYEALRTGRLELIGGRYLGQLALTGMATALSVLGVWAIGMFAMRGNEALPLFGWLCWLSLRAWFFSMPFVGIGLAASQLTSWPMWARVMALGATAGTWVLYAFCQWLEDGRLAVLADLGLQILPQGWMTQMWEPVGWAAPALICSVLGPVFALFGYLFFSRRDL